MPKPVRNLGSLKDGALAEVEAALQSATGAVKAELEKLKQSILDEIAAVQAKINAIETKLNQALTLAENIVNATLDELSSIVAELQRIFADVNTAIAQVKDQINQAKTSLLNGIQGVIDEIGNTADAIKAALGQLKTAITDGVNDALALIDSVKGKVQQLQQQIIDTAKATLADLVAQVQAVRAGVINSLNQALAEIGLVLPNPITTSDSRVEIGAKIKAALTDAYGSGKASLIADLNTAFAQLGIALILDPNASLLDIGKAIAAALGDKVSDAIAQLTTPRPNIYPILSTTNPLAGDVVKVDLGDWGADADLDNATFAWNGQAAASQDSYTTSAADIGNKISVTISVPPKGKTNVAKRTWSGTLRTNPVQARPVANLLVPVLSNPAVHVGDTVTVTPGEWETAATISYVWSVDGTVVSNTASYTVAPAHVGKTLKVEVTATPQTGSNYQANSVRLSTYVNEGVLAVELPPSLSTLTPTVGSPVYVVGGQWSATPDSLTFAWNDGAPGALRSFTPNVAGDSVTVSVKATKAGYRDWTGVLMSAPVSAAPSDPGTLPVDTPQPTVTAPPVTVSPEPTPTSEPTNVKSSLQVANVHAPQNTFALTAGRSFALKAVAYTVKGTKAALKWTSSNPKVATVSNTGIVKANKIGATTITATAGTKSVKISLKVVKPKTKSKVSRVTAIGVRKTLQVGQAIYLTGKYSPTTAYLVNVDFKSSKTALATVDAHGRVLAKKAGTVYITVKAGNKSKKYKITVTK